MLLDVVPRIFSCLRGVLANSIFGVACLRLLGASSYNLITSFKSYLFLPLFLLSINAVAPNPLVKNLSMIISVLFCSSVKWYS